MISYLNYIIDPEGYSRFLLYSLSAHGFTINTSLDLTCLALVFLNNPLNGVVVTLITSGIIVKFALDNYAIVNSLCSD